MNISKALKEGVSEQFIKKWVKIQFIALYSVVYVRLMCVDLSVC